MRPLLLVLNVIQDSQTRTFIRMVLESAGHRVVDAARTAQAQSLLGNGLNPDLVFCEASSADLSQRDCFLLLEHACKKSFCLITKASERNVRQEASAHGVQHFLSKPVTRFDLESLIDLVSHVDGQPAADAAAPVALPRAIVSSAAEQDEERQATNDMHLAPYIEELDGNNFFLAVSPKMREIHRQVKLLADIDVNVLLLGESGTGKEVVAQLIHRNSRRSREKFLKVNCAALPAELLESELFGHRQGAFTGAITDRAGKFEQANRGTLLLDEIGEIGVQMQAKLLHVLQDGQFARLGAQETTKVDVRVLAATNVQIEEAMLNGTFREDLYYRLNVFTIKVPPLRERREEIPYLVEQIIRRSPAEMRKGFGPNFSSRLMDAALLYEWRGNVRELRNFVTRTMVMRDSDAAARELEAKVAASAAEERQDLVLDVPPHCAGFRSIVRDVKERTEAEMIRNALEAFAWNRRRAAQHLNISYRSLLYKIQQHRLKPRPFATPNRSVQGVGSTRHTAL